MGRTLKFIIVHVCVVTGSFCVEFAAKDLITGAIFFLFAEAFIWTMDAMSTAK
jgi:hypothetical protein